MTRLTNSNKKNKRGTLSRQPIITASIVTMALTVFPQVAMAADTSTGSTPMFSTMLDSITTLVNTVFLPIAIVIAGWKIIYLAIFPGLMSADPFNQVPDGYSLQWDAIWTLIKYRLTGFFKGVLWIGGIWILFNLIISIVSVLAKNLDQVL